MVKVRILLLVVPMVVRLLFSWRLLYLKLLMYCVRYIWRTVTLLLLVTPGKTRRLMRRIRVMVVCLWSVALTLFKLKD